jgi:hypothetical protein
VQRLLEIHLQEEGRLPDEEQLGPQHSLLGDLQEEDRAHQLLLQEEVIPGVIQGELQEDD